ncbi:YceI family protein [Gramella sp. KN1008]|uniref:YceI family protein n=1 Tax=Gramella sp. KN1008 TaxID=2529298 RepID=UPI0013F1712C|nr:YceI family protein [Gramella sp. KN1008]
MIFIVWIGFTETVRAQFYQTTSASVRFYSSAPVEDIEAISKEGISVINSKNGDISFKVKMRSFRFEKALMQEHFNENYVESEIYPDATFKGKSIGPIDTTFGRTQKVVFKGVFTVHGVSKERELPVIIKMSDDGKIMSLSSEFRVKCEDHDIKIPKILWENIAEVIDVYVNAEYKIISK